MITVEDEDKAFTTERRRAPWLTCLSEGNTC